MNDYNNDANRSNGNNSRIIQWPRGQELAGRTRNTHSPCSIKKLITYLNSSDEGRNNDLSLGDHGFRVGSDPEQHGASDFKPRISSSELLAIKAIAEKGAQDKYACKSKRSLRVE